MLLVPGIGFLGCHHAALPPSSAQSAKVYKLRGVVVRTNPSTSEVTLNHQAIPGFMDAMTMPYKLKDPNLLSELHPGDVLTADLLVPQDPNGDVLLDHIVIVAQGKPDYRPAVSYHVPAPGDAVPDFKLRNQDGHSIDLAQFKGDAVLITFIYTRCPLPDFCPRVTRNFAQVNRQLSADPAVYAHTHLLCVSFDPEHDTPDRLRAYGATYIGSDAPSAFTHWDFAVPEPKRHEQKGSEQKGPGQRGPDQDAVKQMAQYFDVGLSAGPDETFTHTLSTTLIGPDGKVVRFYPGNGWTADQLVADVRHELGS
jgi:protein SCO1/2